MRPIVLQHGLGWLHLPANPRASGVVLCPALGREARWSYRTMRQLADRLATEGLTTLRFDYPGTGDAPDLLPGDDLLAAWRQSVHAAVDWLRTETGLEQVALCGLRFGALLAAEVAASRTDIGDLALLSPILSGRHCARELRLAAFGGEGDDGPEDGIEVDGMVLPDATLGALTEMDLRACTKLPAPRILILDEGNRAAPLATRLEALGGEVTLHPFPGYPAMMRVATSNQVPYDALGTVAAWFGTRDQPRPLAGSLTRLPIKTALSRPGWCEHVVQFGAERSLVGTLCAPPNTRTSSPAVLIANTGGDGRSGIARFGVRLAHSLAEAGIASLRFDFAGLGDSTLPHDVDGHLYQASRTSDIAAALDVLETLGYERVSGIGLCTGAYHLLHAALVGVRFDHLALINLVTFRWQSGDILEVPQRALGAVAAQTANMAPQSQWDGAAPAISGVLDRGTRMLMLLGQGDPGIAALEASFGPDGRDLAARPGATVRFEAGIDHTLSRRVMQDRVASAVTTFLSSEEAVNA